MRDMGKDREAILLEGDRCQGMRLTLYGAMAVCRRQVLAIVPHTQLDEYKCQPWYATFWFLQLCLTCHCSAWLGHPQYALTLVCPDPPTLRPRDTVCLRKQACKLFQLWTAMGQAQPSCTMHHTPQPLRASTTIGGERIWMLKMPSSSPSCHCKCRSHCTHSVVINQVAWRSDCGSLATKPERLWVGCHNFFWHVLHQLMMVCASGGMTIFFALRMPEHVGVECAFLPEVQDPGTHTWKTGSGKPIGEVVVDPLAPKMVGGWDGMACSVEPPFVVCVQASLVVAFLPRCIKARIQQPSAHAAMHTTEMVTKNRVRSTHRLIMGRAFTNHLPGAEPAMGMVTKATTLLSTGQLSDLPTMAKA